MSKYFRIAGIRLDRRIVLGAVLLLVCGNLWGTVPMLSKIAGGLDAHPVGLSLVVNSAGALVCVVLCLIQGTLRWPTRRELVFFFNWAILFSVVNQVLIYWLSARMDAAVVSAFTVLEGLVIFAAAGCLGLEKYNPMRCCGLLLGLLGAFLLVASQGLFQIEGQALMSPMFLCVGLLIPLSYAAESLFMAAKRPPSVDPLYAVLGVMVISVPMLFALALATDDFMPLQFPPGRTEVTAFAIMLATLVANLLYFRLIALTGSVFSGQISYFNALCGIGWGVLVLGEKWPLSMSAAFGLMLVGLLLVRPQAVKLEAHNLPQQQPWPAE